MSDREELVALLKVGVRESRLPPSVDRYTGAELPARTAVTADTVDEANARMAEAAARIEAQDKRIEEVRHKVQAVIDACDSARMVELGAGGMTIEAQIRRSVYNGVAAWPVEELRALLARLEGGE